DTVPNAAGWPVGTRLWVLEDDLGTSVVEWVQGEVVEAAAATNAGDGTLPVASAPQSTADMDAPAARPYPPAALTVNTEAWPVELFGELTLEWVHRDRLLQADQLVDQSAGSIGPEAGTTYTVRTYLNDALHDEQTGITGDTATVEPTLD